MVQFYIPVPVGRCPVEDAQALGQVIASSQASPTPLPTEEPTLTQSKASPLRQQVQERYTEGDRYSFSFS